MEICQSNYYNSTNLFNMQTAISSNMLPELVERITHFFNMHFPFVEGNFTVCKSPESNTQKIDISINQNFPFDINMNIIKLKDNYKILTETEQLNPYLFNSNEYDCSILENKASIGLDEEISGQTQSLKVVCPPGTEIKGKDRLEKLVADRMPKSILEIFNHYLELPKNRHIIKQMKENKIELKALKIH